jgi:hypothetical protein
MGKDQVDTFVRFRYPLSHVPPYKNAKCPKKIFKKIKPKKKKMKNP